MIKSVITLSGSSFYRKLISKYQGKINSFRFPIMIFCKNTERLLPKKINMNVLVQFYFHNLNTISSLIAKGIEDTKELFRAKKYISQFIQKLETLKNIQLISMKYKITSGTLPEGDVFVEMADFVSFLKAVFSISDNMKFALNHASQPSYLATKTATHQQVNYCLLSYGDRVQIKNPQTWGAIGSNKQVEMSAVHSPLIQKENVPESHSVFKHKSSVIILQGNLLLNNKTLFNTSFYPQTSYNVISQNGTVTHLLLSCDDYVQNVNSQRWKIKNGDKPVYAGHYLSSDKESKLDYHSEFETKLLVILPQANLLLNNPLLNISSQELNNRTILYKGKDLFKKTHQNPTAFIKPIVKSNNYNGEFNAGDFIPLYKNDVLKDNDNFYFQNTRKIEQNIERVKKIAEEAKEAVIKIPIPTSSEVDIKRQMDITRLSDQVYQNIERRIRIEKERRGI